MLPPIWTDVDRYEPVRPDVHRRVPTLTDVNRCSLMVAGVDPHEPIWTTGHRRSLGGVDIGIGTSALRQTYTDFTILTIL